MKPQDYLSKEGKVIFAKIAKYLEEAGFTDDVNSYELSMLANSFDIYAKAAKEVRDEGYQQYNDRSKTMSMTPAYNIMKIEYSNMTKHAPKFGINPVDLKKVVQDQKKDPEDALDKLMSA